MNIKSVIVACPLLVLVALEYISGWATARLSQPTPSLTLHLLTAYSGKAGKPLIPKGKLSAIQLRAAINLAQTQLGNELTLDQLASAVNMSPFHFTRLFKNTTGVSPHQFILRLRLERAKRLLLMRQLSLMEIAQAVGFLDQAHFTNTFRPAFGMTPKAFVQCL